MTNVNIKKEYLSGEKTEIVMLESILGSGSSKINCFVFDFKSLSKNDLAQILVALERWIINNYKPELHPTWDARECANTAYFDSYYERIETIISNILFIIQDRNGKEKLKMYSLLKEFGEKTRQLKEAGEKITNWVAPAKSHTCSAGCEPDMCSLIKKIN